MITFLTVFDHISNTRWQVLWKKQNTSSESSPRTKQAWANQVNPDTWSWTPLDPRANHLWAMSLTRQPWSHGHHQSMTGGATSRVISLRNRSRPKTGIYIDRQCPQIEWQYGRQLLLYNANQNVKLIAAFLFNPYSSPIWGDRPSTLV